MLHLGQHLIYRIIIYDICYFVGKGIISNKVKQTAADPGYVFLDTRVQT